MNHMNKKKSTIKDLLARIEVLEAQIIALRKENE